MTIDKKAAKAAYKEHKSVAGICPAVRRDRGGLGKLHADPRRHSEPHLVHPTPGQPSQFPTIRYINELL